MKSIIDQLLGYAGAANQLLRVPLVNTPVDQFDSSSGVRNYTVRIFQILSLALLVVMIYNCAYAFLQYMKAEHTGLEKAGSIISFLLCLYAAFPLAHLIRSRGESLGGNHNGMISFLFQDAAKAGIRLVGELSAVVLLFHSLCLLVAFLFQASVFEYTDTTYVLTGVSSTVASLLATVSGWASTGLSVIGIQLDLGSIVSVNSVSYTSATSTGAWSEAGFMEFVKGLVAVLLTMVSMYVVLAFYSFCFNLASTFLKWVSNPTLPVSVKSR